MTTLENQIQAYAQQVQQQPDNPSVLMAYAEANLMSGQNLEALKVFQKVSQDHPDQADARLAIARIYLSQKKYEESYAEVSQMLSMWPTYAGAHLMLKLLLKQADVPLEYIETIRQVNGYLPSVEEVQGLRHKLDQERTLINQDIDEFNRARQDGDSTDPVLEYHILRAQMRLTFLEGAVGILDSWEKSRVDQEQEEQARIQAEVEQERRRQEEEEHRQAEEVERLERQRLEEEDRERERLYEEQMAAEAASARPTPSPERLAFYEQQSAPLGEVVATLAKTRNVGAALIVAQDGFVVQRELKETASEDDISQFVRDCLMFFEEHHPGKFSLWVLEFEKGILVTQSIHEQHVLVLLGSTGANFGALKFAMDKARPQLTSILASVPGI